MGFPWLPGGLLWFLLGLAPAFGLSGMSNSRLNDRFMYMPMLGLIAAILFLPWQRWLAGQGAASWVCRLAD